MSDWDDLAEMVDVPPRELKSAKLTRRILANMRSRQRSPGEPYDIGANAARSQHYNKRPITLAKINLPDMPAD